MTEQNVMAGSAVTLAEVSQVGGHRIGTVQDLRIAISVVTRRANAGDGACQDPGHRTCGCRCGLGTDVVVDTPDGTSWRIASVSYQEDLAGAMVITLADPMSLDGDDQPEGR